MNTRTALIPFWGLFLIAMIAAACRASAGTAPAPLTATATLTQTLAPTETATAAPASFLPAASPPAAQPTPEPKIRVVKEGDTLSSIAFAAGVSVQDLLASNPELDERIISLGQKVAIPPLKNGKPVLPQPTPIELPFLAPECVRTAEGGAWCISQALNSNAEAVEGCSVQISLLNQAGEALASHDTAAPLERLAPGRTAPVLAYFPPPLPQAAAVSLRILTCLPTNPADGRFLAPQAQVNDTRVAPGGLSALVRGNVTLPQNSPPAALVSIMAAGYDNRGRIIGVKKWQAQGQFSSQEVLPFELSVYSLSGPIVSVDVQVEARPKP